MKLPVTLKMPDKLKKLLQTLNQAEVWNKLKSFKKYAMKFQPRKYGSRVYLGMIFVGLGLCVIWSAVLFIFLLSLGYGKDGILALGAAVASILACVLFYIAADKLLLGYPSPQFRYFVFAFFAVGIFTVIAIHTPYSPAHDSYDMSGFLSQVLRGENFSPYARAYLSFTATNKITLFLYAPWVKHFQSVKLGTQVFNFLLMLSAIFLLSGSAWRMFGERAGEIALLVLIPFAPYLMLTGPYIYPPSIFISALAMFLYQGRTQVSKIFAYIAFGILYILRPTALGFMFVYVTVYGVLSWKNRKVRWRSIENLALLFVFCVLVNTAAGGWMHSSGQYPYPNLTTSAKAWTMELGTRMQGTETGKCTYSAYGKYFDNISTQFHRLWEIYAQGNSEDVDQIKFLHKQIDKEIKWRTKTTVLDSPQHLWQFLTTKYKNLFGDEYKPYYYMTNISGENFGRNLSRNYERRYFLYENILLVCVAGGTAAVCGAAGYTLWKRRRISDYLRKAIALAAGITAVFVIFILMTEVGKRLVFDVFTPILLLICYMTVAFTQFLQKKARPEKQMVIVPGAAVIAFGLVIGVQSAYGVYDMKELRDTRIEYVGRQIRLIFPEPIKGCYRIWEEDEEGGRTQFLQGKTEIMLNAGKYDRKEIELQLPNGDLYVITNLREY